MYNPPLVPDDFDLPQALETPRVRIRPLTANDAVKDYDAVITSSERLRTVYDPAGKWPLGLTLEQAHAFAELRMTLQGVLNPFRDCCVAVLTQRNCHLDNREATALTAQPRPPSRQVWH